MNTCKIRLDKHWQDKQLEVDFSEKKDILIYFKMFLEIAKLWPMKKHNDAD